MSLREFGDLFSHVDSLVRYLQDHPSLADAALRALPKPESREEESDKVSDTTYETFVQPFEFYPFSMESHWNWESIMPDPDRLQREWDAPPMVFAGDHVDLLPFGWWDAFKGRYKESFAVTLPDPPWMPPGSRDPQAPIACPKRWRAAGFALWDRSRVEAIKQHHQLRGLTTGWAGPPDHEIATDEEEDY